MLLGVAVRSSVMSVPRTFLPLILLGISVAAYPREMITASSQMEQNIGPNPRVKRIIKGDFAEKGEFPGQVSIQLAGVHMFGGSIVTNIWILTTARAATKFTDGYMVMAESNMLISGGTYHRVAEAISYEGYNESSHANDIALLKLKDPIMLGKFAIPVILPSTGEVLSEGTPGTVVGWGWYRDAPAESDLLRKEKIVISNHAKCDKAYSEFGIRISSTQICAEDVKGQTGPCSGDAGGPFIVNGKVVGIISFSLGCVVEGYPNVLTDVLQYMNWIREVVTLHHLNDRRIAFNRTESIPFH